GGDSVERAITIDASLEAAQVSDNIHKTQTMTMPNVDIPKVMETGGSPGRQKTMRELAQKLYAEELAKETARQEQEKYNLEKALELQRKLDKREEDVDKGDQTKEIDKNDPTVLRYHALQNRPFSKAEKLDEQTDEEVEAQAETDQEIEEMKLYVKIVPDEDIAIDAITLATKPPVIGEYKIVKEGRFNTYHIIRADGSTKRYTSMINLLKNIDKENLEALWKLVKDKHRNTRLEECYERVL
nr:hypothetical protein [Tanacetum cinerariifolium]